MWIGVGRHNSSPVMESGANASGSDARESQSIEKQERSTNDSGPRAEADEAQHEHTEDWTISKHELYIILSLTIINMVVALDASVIVTALNVSIVSCHKRATPF